jgi:hypothetical protein
LALLAHDILVLTQLLLLDGEHAICEPKRLRFLAAGALAVRRPVENTRLCASLHHLGSATGAAAG